MLLRDLDARFLKFISEREYEMIETLEGADGIIFQCPKCAEGKPVEEEDGRRFVRGAHSVICWFRGHVPDSVNPKPGRWTPSGIGLDDLTFVPGNPPMAVSVLLNGPGCGWHGFVRDGEATPL